MPEQPLRDIKSVVPDATALKALTHPLRLRMLGLLRIEGPATASGLAARLGLNSGATSYHLRQLAQHGFIEEDAARGSQRDRWWRARHEATSVMPAHAEGEALELGLAFEQAALHGQMRQMQRALAAYPELPQAWRQASTVSDYTIPMTAEAARALVEKLQTLLWEAMAAAPALGTPLPENMRPMTFILHAAPNVGEPQAGEAQ
ncbi:ArsR family transcriptional regulator [Devosia sp. Root436]|uniref:winged helix-turn-helix domain-containing protein n=1 Tax=Devosia sp. Root436 TaxID=1736537 RepID=UPI0006FE0C1C|nr:winged helix-turn-helix domain-containing protein [Devosia sp. Root436]KQX42866.1 ArsR family transcriptional regulator [Devosia sp. Root436]